MTLQDTSFNDCFEVIKALAAKEIEFCKNEDELRIVRKRWDKYMASYNKFLMGKGGMPYFDEDGKVVIDDIVAGG